LLLYRDKKVVSVFVRFRRRTLDFYHRKSGGGAGGGGQIFILAVKASCLMKN
jgi:hypothetical protein